MVDSKEDGKDKLIVWKKILLIEIIVFEVLYIAGAIFFSNHFLLNSEINGVDVSLMTADQAQETLETALQNYRLEIQEREGKIEYITGADIDLQFELTGTSEEVMNRQTIFFWFVNIFHEKTYTLASEVSFNENKLKKQVQELNGINKTTSTAPIEPQIVRGEEGFVVKEGIPGNQLSPDETLAAIRIGISNLMLYVNMEKANCYRQLQYQVDSPAVQAAVRQLNHILKMKITYRLGNQTEELVGDKIIEWVSVSEEYVISVDQEAVKEYVDEIKTIYQENGSQIKFQTATGETAGLNSYVTDSGEALFDSEYLSNLILDDENGDTTDFLWEPSGNMAVGDTYIEINASEQHLYGYQNGRLVVEADIDLKLPRGNPVPVGIYTIREKGVSETLNGKNWRKTPVENWIAFDGGTALYSEGQAAASDPGRYTACGIELETAQAAALYENYEIGDLVVIYTEDSFETDSNGNPTDNNTRNPAPDNPANNTDASEDTSTEPPTENPTEQSPQQPVEPQPQQPSEPQPQQPTETPGVQPTESPTEPTTQQPSEEPTDTPTEGSTEASTEIPTI